MKNKWSGGRCISRIMEARVVASCLIRRRRGVYGSAACLFISIALAACGEGNDGGSGVTSTAETKEMAAAADAASSTVVSAATAFKMNDSGITPDTEIDRFIIKYKTGTKERGAASEVQSKLDKYRSSFPARAHHSRRMGVGSDVVVMERKLNAKETKAFMRAVASDPDVEYVEPDVEVSMAAQPIPNDPLYYMQWGLFSNLDPGQQNVGIRLGGASTIASGAGIVIGLVDNGMTSHSDLDANVIPEGFDFTFLGPPGGSNPGVSNGTRAVNFHGTHVAGIMAARSQNGIGVAGIAPSAKLLSARALSQYGVGALSSASDAIMWASGGLVPGIPMNSHPATVINASLESAGMCSKAFQNSIDYATSHGVIVVVAAGNESAEASNAQPANCRGVIAVGSTQEDGSRSSFSNYGPTVDIAAPGSDIYSTYNTGVLSLGTESYAYLSGTSMATPMVSGVVALIQSVAPKPLSAAEMRTLITRHAQPFPKQPDQFLGLGILDATAAVTAAKAGEIPAAADFTCSQSTTMMQVTCTDLSTARGSAAIQNRTWNFGEGDSDLVVSQLTNPVHNYDHPGTYNVTLTIRDSTGATSRVSRPFVVVAPEATDLAFDNNLLFAAKKGVIKYFKVDVPAGAKSLRVNLSNRSSLETGTMYVSAGSPTAAKANCTRVFASGSGAQCFMSAPAPGVWYIALSPSTDLNDDVIYAIYTP